MFCVLGTIGNCYPSMSPPRVPIVQQAFTMSGTTIRCKSHEWGEKRVGAKLVSASWLNGPRRKFDRMWAQLVKEGDLETLLLQTQSTNGVRIPATNINRRAPICFDSRGPLSV